MRHLRSFAAVLTIAAITAACTPGSSGNESQGGGEGSQGQPAASTGGGGGGGGGGGANGSVTYEITGGFEASGELPFLAGGVSIWIESVGGWVANFGNTSGEGAIVQLNTQDAEGTPGQIFNYGDGTVLVSAVSGDDTGMGCTFNLDQNDATGLKGSVDCTNANVINNTTGAIAKANLHAEWDAHP